MEDTRELVEEDEPPRVLPVKRLFSDIEALKKLTKPAIPPRARLWALNILLVLYVHLETPANQC